VLAAEAVVAAAAVDHRRCLCLNTSKQNAMQCYFSGEKKKGTTDGGRFSKMISKSVMETSFFHFYLF
jgi:hypothetical protein